MNRKLNGVMEDFNFTKYISVILGALETFSPLFVQGANIVKENRGNGSNS